MAIEVPHSFWSQLAWATRGDVEEVLSILRRMETGIAEMNARENTAWDAYQGHVSALVDGYKASRALNELYANAYEQLSQSQQKRIDDAVKAAHESDSEYDADRLEAADRSLTDVLDGMPPLPEGPRDHLPTDTQPDPETGEQAPPNQDPTTLPHEMPATDTAPAVDPNREVATDDPDDGNPTPDRDEGEHDETPDVTPDENATNGRHGRADS